MFGAAGEITGRRLEKSVTVAALDEAVDRLNQAVQLSFDLGHGVVVGNLPLLVLCPGLLVRLSSRTMILQPLLVPFQSRIVLGACTVQVFQPLLVVLEPVGLSQL